MAGCTDLWIKIVKFDGFNNSTVTLRFPKPMHITIVTSQYGELFEEAFENSVRGYCYEKMYG